MDYNSPEGFAYLLQTFFGYVWQFFQVEIPFFGIPIGTFLIALAAASLLIRVVMHLLGGGEGVSSHATGSGNKYYVDDK